MKKSGDGKGMDPRIREDDGQGQSFLRPPVIPAPSCHSCTLLSFLRRQESIPDPTMGFMLIFCMD